MMARLTAVWEAPGLRTPRVSIGFKATDGDSLVLCYDVRTCRVTDAFRGDKVRRVVQRQAHFVEVAQVALAAHALGIKPMLEIDL